MCLWQENLNCKHCFGLVIYENKSHTHFLANTSLCVFPIKASQKKTLQCEPLQQMSHFSSLLKKKNVSNHAAIRLNIMLEKPFMADKKGQRPTWLISLEEMRQAVTIRKEPHSHHFLNTFIDTKPLQQCVNVARSLAHAAESDRGGGGGENNTINCDPPSLLSATMATAALQFRRRVLTVVRFWVALLFQESVWEWDAPRSSRDHQSAFK